MPGWLTALLMWGGSAVAIISVIAVVYAIIGAAPGAPMTLYVMLIVAGLAAAIIGWLLQRRKGSSGS